jgi:hypothetical protein
MTRLRGAAEIEKVGMVNDQGAVKAQLIKGGLKKLNACIDFTLGV